MTKFMQKRVKKNPWYRVKRVSEKLNFSQKVDKKLKEIEKFHEKKSSIKYLLQLETKVVLLLGDG